MQATGVRPGARPTAAPGAELRAVRAALFTALCTTLSATSHVLLSRAPLPPVTVAAICAGIFAAAYALTGRARGYGAFAALLVPLELAADTVFTAGQHTCYGRAGGPVTGPLHSVGVDLLCRGGELGTPLARMAAHPSAPLPPAVPAAAPWLLLAAHLAVGLLAAGWLHRGDAALDALLRAAAAATFRPLLTAVTLVTAALTRPRRQIRPLHPLPPARPLPLLVHCVRRRGPPCPSAA
ncbi:hypothetical protein DY245_41870 [Streptomyces inhibens]|uniref:Integral membrane protein n=1 Tax=Streptomyces inhibens TaxID=2293571 RepID=A0A371PQQ4_STRIH|nr:hypothetical protein [Streptomyces inhibens]REK84679.1 hypothetical protein DY245_41870 [Streptomyces inhibens]